MLRLSNRCMDYKLFPAKVGVLFHFFSIACAKSFIGNVLAQATNRSGERMLLPNGIGLQVLSLQAFFQRKADILDINLDFNVIDEKQLEALIMPFSLSDVQSSLVRRCGKVISHIGLFHERRTLEKINKGPQCFAINEPDILGGHFRPHNSGLKLTKHTASRIRIKHILGSLEELPIIAG